MNFDKKNAILKMLKSGAELKNLSQNGFKIFIRKDAERKELTFSEVQEISKIMESHRPEGTSPELSLSIIENDRVTDEQLDDIIKFIDNTDFRKFNPSLYVCIEDHTKNPVAITLNDFILFADMLRVLPHIPVNADTAGHLQTFSF